MKHEDPCPCQKRRTRVVFPSGDAAGVWLALFGFITAAFLAWAAWLSSEVVTQGKTVAGFAAREFTERQVSK